MADIDYAIANIPAEKAEQDYQVYVAFKHACPARGNIPEISRQAIMSAFSRQRPLPPRFDGNRRLRCMLWSKDKAYRGVPQ